MDNTKIFTKIYNKKIWAMGENVPLSGRGSSLNYNKKYLPFLQNFIEPYANILDIGCGDMTTTAHLNLSNKNYTGIDCVESVIENNKSKYQTESIKFICKDIVKGLDYNGYDLIIIKDVLQHLSNEDIISILDSLPKVPILIVNGISKIEKERSVKNYYHYSPLNFKHYPLSKYNIKPIFQYKFKEVGVINLL